MLNNTNQVVKFVFKGFRLSKYPDSEMLFQKQNISRDVQNMMPKIIIYRSRPKKKYVHRVAVYLAK